LLAYKNKDDNYAFINRLPPDKSYLQNLKKEFEKKAKNLIGSEFDRGFFSAWYELVHHVSTSNLLEEIRNKKEQSS